MGFKSILKKIGEGALIVGASGAVGIPGVQLGSSTLKALLNKGQDPVTDFVDSSPVQLIQRVDSIIAAVERIGAASGMTGEQKKQAVVSEAMVIVTQSMGLANRKVGDEALLQKALDGTAQAVTLLVQARVDFLNALKADD